MKIMRTLMALSIMLIGANAWAQCPDTDSDGIPGAIITPGVMEVNEDAAMVGECGMEVFIDGVNGAWVADESPDGEKVYRASFRYDVNGASMERGHSMVVMEGRGSDWENPGGTRKTFRVVVKRKGSGYYLRVKAWYNTDKKLTSPVIFLGAPGSSGTKAVEMEWWAGDLSDPYGHCRIRVDGGAWSDVAVKNRLLDVSQISLGVFLFTSPNTSGSNYFDAFESYRTLSE